MCCTYEYMISLNSTFQGFSISLDDLLQHGKISPNQGEGGSSLLPELVITHATVTEREQAQPTLRQDPAEHSSRKVQDLMLSSLK